MAQYFILFGMKKKKPNKKRIKIDVETPHNSKTYLFMNGRIVVHQIKHYLGHKNNLLFVIFFIIDPRVLVSIVLPRPICIASPDRIQQKRKNI